MAKTGVGAAKAQHPTALAVVVLAGDIVIMAGSASGSVALRARGGEGGWQPLRQLPTNQAYGPGGGGGGGYIAYNVTGFSTVAVDGGAGGRTTATAVSRVPTEWRNRR